MAASRMTRRRLLQSSLGAMAAKLVVPVAARAALRDRVVIVNADDLGLSAEIDRGILNQPALAARTSYTNRSSRVDVGSQPFLDQRFVRESGAKHHRGKTSSRKKKTSTSSKKKKKVSSDEQ